MSDGVKYWTSVTKRILGLVLAFLSVWIGFKLVIFYMPFLIAFIIALIIEPLIKKIMKRFKLSRKISSIIVFIITFGIIIALLSFGIGTLISESTNLLEKFNDYYVMASKMLNNLLLRFDLSNFKIPDEILNIVQETGGTILEKVSDWVQKFFSNFLNMITSIPTFGIYFGITILSLYFICTDKIYMLDELEHHLPEKWMKKLSKHLREIIKCLGGYLKAQVKLIAISFIICLVRFVYFTFLRIKCWIPTYYSFSHRICRRTSDFRLWKCYDSLGNNFGVKRGFNLRHKCDYTLDNYVIGKTVYRAKNCKWQNRHTSNFYNCSNVYRL